MPEVSNAIAMDYEKMDWLDLRSAVCSAAPWLDPPAQYWLESDCCPSYCREHAIAARGREFELGPLLVDSNWHQRDDWEDAFFQGIQADPDCCPGTHDSTAACYTCGKTLGYWLTDEGIKQELEHWSDAEISGDWSEIAYNIDRLFECDDDDQEEVRALGIRFLTAVEASKRSSTD
jgi:hypothetical protein